MRMFILIVKLLDNLFDAQNDGNLYEDKIFIISSVIS